MMRGVFCIVQDSDSARRECAVRNRPAHRSIETDVVLRRRTRRQSADDHQRGVDAVPVIVPTGTASSSLIRGSSPGRRRRRRGRACPC